MLQIERKASATKFQSVTLWTDNCVVLDWIQFRNKLKSFVANRVNEIRQLTSFVDWKYVPIDSKPADYGTKSLKLTLSNKSELNASFLTQPPHKWPQRRRQPHAESFCTAAKTKLQSLC